MAVLRQRLWLTADRSKAVPDGDPLAVHFLGGEGQLIDDDEAKRLKLSKDQLGADEPTIAPLEAKAESAPEATKAERGPASTKGARSGTSSEEKGAKPKPPAAKK